MIWVPVLTLLIIIAVVYATALFVGRAMWRRGYDAGEATVRAAWQRGYEAGLEADRRDCSSAMWTTRTPSRRPS